MLYTLEILGDLLSPSVFSLGDKIDFIPRSFSILFFCNQSLKR